MAPSLEALLWFVRNKVIEFVAREEHGAGGRVFWEDYGSVEEVYREFIDAQGLEIEGELADRSRVELSDDLEDGTSTAPDAGDDIPELGPDELLQTLGELVHNRVISKERVRAFVDAL